MRAVSEQPDDTVTSLNLLEAAKGEVPLDSALGRWARHVSMTPPPCTITGPITPTHVLTSPLDHTSVTAPVVTVNQDTNAAPQNETTIAVDPNNPLRLVAGVIDSVPQTWDCIADDQPCSCAFEHSYNNSFYSNDGGLTWCCVSSGPSNIGTIIPGVTLGAGGPYASSGDPVVAFNTQGEVFFAGIAFTGDESGPNAIHFNRGSFDADGVLHWSAPIFLNTVGNNAHRFNDKPWLAIDQSAASPYKDRIYLAWTREEFTGQGADLQQPIVFTYSTDGGHTFTPLQVLSANVKFTNSGTWVTTGPSGEIYVFWGGKDDEDVNVLNSMWVVKSVDGGVSFTDPIEIVTYNQTIGTLHGSLFKVVAGMPAAAVAPNGDVYLTYITNTHNGVETSYVGDPNCEYTIVGTPAVRTNCHVVCVYCKSTDGGQTWALPARVFTKANRAPVGFPVFNPNGSQVNAPSGIDIEDAMPSIAISSTGQVYISAYRGTIVSPWQQCGTQDTPPTEFTCAVLGNYINNNSRYEYIVKNITTPALQTATTHPINTRYYPSGFMGDYTQIAMGPDDIIHAVWIDTNNVQNLRFLGSLEFVPSATPVHQHDIVTRAIPAF